MPGISPHPDSAAPDSRPHLIEASTNFVKGTEYGHGSHSRKRIIEKSRHTGCDVVRRSKAHSTHVHSHNQLSLCIRLPDCHVPFVGRERARSIDVCRVPRVLFREHVVSHRFKARERTAEQVEEVEVLFRDVGDLSASLR